MYIYYSDEINVVGCNIMCLDIIHTRSYSFIVLLPPTQCDTLTGIERTGTVTISVMQYDENK